MHSDKTIKYKQAYIKTTSNIKVVAIMFTKFSFRGSLFWGTASMNYLENKDYDTIK